MQTESKGFNLITKKDLDITSIIIGIIAGGLGGFLIAYVSINRKLNEAKTQARVAEQQVTSLSADNELLKQERHQKNLELTELKTTLATKEAEQRSLQDRLKEQKAEITEIQKRFTEQFDNLANRIFDEKAHKFKLQSEESINKMLDPLRVKLLDFSTKVEKANKDSLEGNSALREQLNYLKELNQKMSKEAENLTKALKGEQKTQGNWGEMILESVLEKSGLVKDREYFTQESVRTEDGRRLQPDVIIKLPENKKIIVDSKVSLVAYERLVSEEDEGRKAGWIKQHILSVRAHVKGLSDKNYSMNGNGDGLDFVLLFIPIEPAFSLAVQHDPDLFTDSFSRNIVIVSPTTLLATLRTIASIWRQEYQSQNAAEIAKQGGDLYDKFVGFAEDLEKIGERIRQTQESYDSAINKLSTGRGNLVRRAENMKSLGVKTNKNLPLKFLDDGLDEE
ncbi:DNA recombination protein RmuC [Fulvivirgaceae bacterium LMO-SS25]